MTKQEAIENLEILKEDYWDDDGYGHETEKYNDTMLALDMAIKALEQEPRKGHWIKGYTFPDGAYWKCDKCNELIKVKFPMNYCNNCGADMREVEE